MAWIGLGIQEDTSQSTQPGGKCTIIASLSQCSKQYKSYDQQTSLIIAQRIAQLLNLLQVHTSLKKANQSSPMHNCLCEYLGGMAYLMKDDGKYCGNGEFGVVVSHVLPAWGNVAFKGYAAVAHHCSCLVHSSHQEVRIHTHAGTLHWREMGLFKL